MANIVIDTIQKIIGEDNYIPFLEGTISNCGCYNNKDCKLEDRGGVYGIAVQLKKEDAKAFFDLANEKDDRLKRGKKVKFDEWKPLNDDFYPLYWGYDSNLGHRLFSHTKARKSTGTVQLNRCDFLKNRTVIYGAVLCKNHRDQEKALRESYPDILTTKKLSE